MPIRGEGLVDEDGDAAGVDGEGREEKVTYVLHPNCGIFDED